jgi:hypothetical protein
MLVHAWRRCASFRCKHFANTCIALELHHLLYLTSQVTGSLFQASVASRCRVLVILNDEMMTANCCSSFSGARGHCRRQRRSRFISSILVSFHHEASSNSGYAGPVLTCVDKAEDRSAWMCQRVTSAQTNCALQRRHLFRETLARQVPRPWTSSS